MHHSAPRKSSLKHGVFVVVDIVVTDDVLLDEVPEELVSVGVVADVVSVVVIVPVVVNVAVCELVVPSAHMLHVVSQRWAAGQVGQNAASHVHWRWPHGSEPLVIRSQVGTQSSYVKQVVADVVDESLAVTVDEVAVEVVVREVDVRLVLVLVLTDMVVRVLVPVVKVTVVVFVVYEPVVCVLVLIDIVDCVVDELV